MGHEIAHAVAQHGRERMSHNLLVATGSSLLEDALIEKPEATRALFLAAAGLGAELAYLLPYSRLHEREADKLGLIFMAMAGYDPREAPGFWRRMQEISGPDPPAFLSTHPSSRSRIENLERLANSEAMKYYRPRRQPAGTPARPASRSTRTKEAP
jgi:predicted Zn-dependent protease